MPYLETSFLVYIGVYLFVLWPPVVSKCLVGKLEKQLILLIANTKLRPDVSLVLSSRIGKNVDFMALIL